MLTLCSGNSHNLLRQAKLQVPLFADFRDRSRFHTSVIRGTSATLYPQSRLGSSSALTNFWASLPFSPPSPPNGFL